MSSRAPETFYVSQGVYNWSADPQGVYFLKKAASYGVPILTAFVNSAPPAFTTFGFTCGGGISDSQFGGFAQYLADVVKHFRDEEGVKFTHVSPMNEPDSVGLSICHMCSNANEIRICSPSDSRRTAIKKE